LWPVIFAELPRWQGGISISEIKGIKKYRFYSTWSLGSSGRVFECICCNAPEKVSANTLLTHWRMSVLLLFMKWLLYIVGGPFCAGCCTAFRATSSEWEGGIDVLPLHV